MTNLFLLHIASFILLASAQFHDEVSYEARGRFICPLEPNRTIRVVMLDKENGKDDIIYGDVKTDMFGNFRVHASPRAYNKLFMAPFLTIYHNCHTKGSRSLTIRKITVQLPYTYSRSGFLFLRSFDIGTWNLETNFVGEEDVEPKLLEKGIYGNLKINETI